MAEKRTSRHTKPGMVCQELMFTIGASGAVTTYAGSVGVSSIAKAATGKYTVTLDRGFAALHFAHGEVIRASGGRLFPGCDGSTASGYTAGSTTFTLRIDDQAGTATEPSSGDLVRANVWFDELDIT